METFRYRLQTLLDQKVERKKEAERHLANTRQKLRDAQEQLAQRMARQQEMEADRMAQRRALLAEESAGIELKNKVSDLALSARRIEDIKDEVMSLRLHIEECKEQLELAVTALAAAAREVEVLNKHRAKGEQRFRAELERKDAIAQDENASSMYDIRRRM